MAAIPSSREDARRRLIFALDVPTVGEAEKLVADVEPSVRFYKIGLELWTGGGRELAAHLASAGHDVFLDLKLHDIPETVARATRSLAHLGARFVTLHGPPSSVRAAAAVRTGRTLPHLLGVTVLTSMDEAECRLEFGLAPGQSVSDLVVARARALVEAGCAGVIASAHEAARVREALPDALIVTPGIRPAGADVADQKRVATPRDATRAGADYLVVGRPIRDAVDRKAVVQAIVDDAWAGFQERAPVAARSTSASQT